MKPCITIQGRVIGSGRPVYVIAEMSANHGQHFDRAVEIIRAAGEAGADAIKLQTYTPDTLTIDCDRPEFRIGKGTPWEGRSLYELYAEAYTPWDWQPKLKILAEELGMHLFSTPFDFSAVEFLEQMSVPAYKVASFELVDIALIDRIAGTGKPMILSVGMASLEEIGQAVSAARAAGAGQIALLKCTSAYPAEPEEMNLRTIAHLAETFGVVAGLSDHSLGIAAPVAAVALGACIIEKHLTLSRADGGPDSAFSLEPAEFADMVAAVRDAQKAVGSVSYELTDHEAASRAFRRSLFVVRDTKAGQVLTEENVRSIRPGYGLPPSELHRVMGRRAARDIPRGTPLTDDLLA